MLTLRSGDTSIVVAPEYGAGLTGWMHGRTPILRRALPDAASGGNAHAMACFPMVPYCNRIGEARFSWRGVAFQLTHNFGDHPHAIHGVGWQRPWTLTHAAADEVALSLQHRADEAWPFSFDARVTYRLTGAALTVTIAMTNRHTAAAPGGIGLHPYFPRANNPALRFPATGAWENGSDALPSRHVPVPAGWQHDVGRPVAGSRLDNCFTGWNGSAETEAGPDSLRIKASSVFRHLQVFTPYWADFFCVEPVSHIPDSLNRPELAAEQAMHVLRPDETLFGTIFLSPKA